MLIYEGNSGTLKMTERMISENFIYSMMTVLNEHINMNKYSYLVFVEF